MLHGAAYRSFVTQLIQNPMAHAFRSCTLLETRRVSEEKTVLPLRLANASGYHFQGKSELVQLLNSRHGLIAVAPSGAKVSVVWAIVQTTQFWVNLFEFNQPLRNANLSLGETQLHEKNLL